MKTISALIGITPMNGDAVLASTRRMPQNHSTEPSAIVPAPHQTSEIHADASGARHAKSDASTIAIGRKHTSAIAAATALRLTGSISAVSRLPASE